MFLIARWSSPFSFYYYNYSNLLMLLYTEPDMDINTLIRIGDQRNLTRGIQKSLPSGKPLFLQDLKESSDLLDILISWWRLGTLHCLGDILHWLLTYTYWDLRTSMDFVQDYFQYSVYYCVWHSTWSLLPAPILLGDQPYLYQELLSHTCPIQETVLNYKVFQLTLRWDEFPPSFFPFIWVSYPTVSIALELIQNKLTFLDH